MLAVADRLFFALHTAIIAFNVFGWIPKRTRRWNLAALLVTAGSWFLLGQIYGRGYCVLTDWHWRIREARGIHETADSFVQLLVRTLTGWEPPSELVRTWTAIIAALALLASLFVNARDWYRTRSSVQPAERTRT